MNDWVVESPSFEEELLNNKYKILNQNGINKVVELIKNKDQEIKRLNNKLMKIDELINRTPRQTPTAIAYVTLKGDIARVIGADKK